MKRRYVLILVYLLILFGVAGCGNIEKKEEKNNRTTSSTTSTKTTTSSSTTTTTKKETVEDKYFKVGKEKVYYGTYKQKVGMYEKKPSEIVLKNDKTCTYISPTGNGKKYNCTYTYKTTKMSEAGGPEFSVEVVILKMEKKYPGNKEEMFMINKKSLYTPASEYELVK